MSKVRKKLDSCRTKDLVKASALHDGDFSSTGFIAGFDCGVEAIVKVLLDKRNKYNSWLRVEEVCKLGKTANFERTVSYRAHIQIIDELLKDLK
jgi:hypothetical protein